MPGMPFVNENIDPDDNRAAVVALIAAPWSRGVVRETGSRRLTVIISAAVARPHVSSISRHLRKLIFEFCRLALTRSEGERGRLRRGVRIEAQPGGSVGTVC